jgi:hypothetical protein
VSDTEQGHITDLRLVHTRARTAGAQQHEHEHDLPHHARCHPPPLAHSLTHSLTFVHSLTRLKDTCLALHTQFCKLTHHSDPSLTHPLTHSPTHPLTHSPTFSAIVLWGSAMPERPPTKHIPGLTLPDTAYFRGGRHTLRSPQEVPIGESRAYTIWLQV